MDVPTIFRDNEEPMFLQDKRLLITGVISEKSIAYAAVQLALGQGADIVVTGFGRGLRLTEQFIKRLSPDCTASAMNSFGSFERTWQERAPLGWDIYDTEAVARTSCALWSEWLPSVTREVIHVDGGAHAIGSAAAEPGERVPAPRRSVATTVAEVAR
jgi:enoyl-[acyl-carrier-protein] reductase (NADH)